MITRIILQRRSVKLRYKMTNCTHYVRIENKAKEAAEFHEQNSRPFGNLGVGMSALASAFEYKDYILHSMNRLQS